VAIATLADLRANSNLGLALTDTSHDSELQDLLDAAEMWLRQVYGIVDFSAYVPDPITGYVTVVEKFFGYNEGAVLYLSDSDPIIRNVRFARIIGDDFFWLQPSRWILQGDGKLWLRWGEFVAPFENVRARRLPVPIAEIDVEYTPSGVPNPILKQAVILTAIANFRNQKFMLSGGLRSESLGSYSYSRDPSQFGMVIPQFVRSLMRPFNRRGRVQVVP
jgi:hypothetical protein